ncbi:nucleotide exchange factor GrpE [bacterium]|jgi:molecular chaperone GrpE (heat shock protein)|nr:nucleotide exchange factor GrpE [bacterium]
MPQSSIADVPNFQELEETVYRKIVRQLEHQKGAIGLLHLQLKARGAEDVSKLIEEKDKIIMSLQSQVETKPDSPGSTTDELEGEVLELQEKLRNKNQEIRQIKTKYNDHLHELNDKIETYETVLGEGGSAEMLTPTIGSEALEAARSTIKGLEEDLKNSLEQLEFYKNQSVQSREELHGLERESTEASPQKIAELEAELEEKDGLIKSLRESSLSSLPAEGTDDTILVENETLRNRIEMLESELKSLTRSASSRASKDATVELLDSILDLYQGCANLARSQEPDSPVSILQNSVLELSSQFGLEPFESLGESFDPNKHHCIDAVYSTHSVHDTVFRETVPGFLRMGKVFRKASVIVSKNPVHCHNCGTEGTEHSQFCAQCGTKLLMDSHGENEPIFVDDEENAHAYIDLGESYLRKREFQFAHDAFKKAHTLYPDSVQAIVGLARVCESRGQYEEALTLLEKLSACPGMLERRKEYKDRIEKKQRILQDLQEL